jgi:hypothetical protein
MPKLPHDWPDRTKRFLFNLFLIALLIIAIVKVLIEELHGLHR